VKAPRVVVMGTDCALGKRTTARWLRDACQAEGLKTELIYTGQTGWMQSAHDYGFILDATPNDFVSGELESAIVRCDRELAPQLILIEGQSALRNPSGPCGAEFLSSAQAKGVILQHAPGRELYKTTERPWPMADIADDIKIIQLYGSEVLAVTLNGEGVAEADREGVRAELEQRLGLPVFLPLEQGVSGILPLLRDFVVREVKS
ncbi:MAG: NAD-dependent epimerase/dehydratase family protein, partial [Deltaproteobacteria bacterium]